MASVSPVVPQTHTTLTPEHHPSLHCLPASPTLSSCDSGMDMEGGNLDVNALFSSYMLPDKAARDEYDTLDVSNLAGSELEGEGLRQDTRPDVHVARPRRSRRANTRATAASNPLAAPPAPTPPTPVSHADFELDSDNGSVVGADTTASKGRRQRLDPGRNARMARENRERKKAFVAGLEKQVADLKALRKRDDEEKQALQAKLLHASREVEYLRTMLKNAPALAALMSSATAGGAAMSFGLGTAAAASADGKSAPPTTASPAVEGFGFGRVLPIQLNLHLC